MKYLAIIFLTWLASSVLAQTQIKIEDVGKHVGDSVKICSKIYSGKYMESSKGSPTFLNMGGNYPNAPLTLIIWNDTRQQFKKAPEEYFKGVDVCVTGRVQMFKGKPEIIVTKQDQIQEIIIDKLQVIEPK